MLLCADGIYYIEQLLLHNGIASVKKKKATPLPIFFQNT